MHARLRPSPPPVRLVAPDQVSPFAPGRETVLARVEGDALRALGLADGDHVVLVRRDHAADGDVAAVLDERGEATLWRVHAAPDGLHLSTGRSGEGRRVSPAPRIHGVVVAVLRRPA